MRPRSWGAGLRAAVKSSRSFCLSLIERRVTVKHRMDKLGARMRRAATFPLGLYLLSGPPRGLWLCSARMRGIRLRIYGVETRDLLDNVSSDQDWRGQPCGFWLEFVRLLSSHVQHHIQHKPAPTVQANLQTRRGPIVLPGSWHSWHPRRSRLVGPRGANC